MIPETIAKNRQELRVAPNLRDYAQTRAGFDWARAAPDLRGVRNLGKQGLLVVGKRARDGFQVFAVPGFAVEHD